MGVSGTIHPIEVNFASLSDLAILIVVSFVTLIFARKRNIGRIEGAAMAAIYIADVIFAIVR